MNIVFRVRYVTVPGQLLWLKLWLADGVRELPMRWLNHEQWELEIETGPLEQLRYAYQFREQGNGVVLDEWGEGRVVVPGNARCIHLNDTWRSAATIDYAYRSKALEVLMPQRSGFARPPEVPAANTRFRIQVAAVPPGMAVCLSGSADGLGGWSPGQLRPMQEVAADVWQLDVDLPQAGRVEYKYALCDSGSGALVCFELGENRLLEVDPSAHRCWVQDEGFRRDDRDWHRGAGVAVPVFSLRSDDGLGVGEFADLAALADWAAALGIEMIQILPVHDTTSADDWTDSYPYSAISVFALHPLYLRVDALGLPMPAAWAQELAERRGALNALEAIDYEAVMEAKLRLTRAVFDRHRKAVIADQALRAFIEDHRGWLPAYAAFCVLRDHYGCADFSRWGEHAVFSNAMVEAMMAADHPWHADLYYWMWLQFELDAQLSRAVEHLHSHSVVLKGDLPIGIDRESVEAWSAPQLFHLDAQAGAPPDDFSEKGQNWGFPTYHWERMQEDGFAWWRARFEHLSQYFDAFRIDHILGFFRIWQVPADQVEGIMGWFDPAQPVHIDEFRERGIAFDYDRFCRPHLTRCSLQQIFAGDVDEVIATYLQPDADGGFRLRSQWDTQRKVVDDFAGRDGDKDRRIRQGLLDCISEVLFFEVPGSGGSEFHPRFFLQKTRSFEDLDERTKERVDGLYVNYFFHRQDFHWKARGLDKLPALRRASAMLLCGEDLGLVPDCVPGVMRELGILSLEIQRMPKSHEIEFGDPMTAPYLSVVSPSTHDMPSMREWWHKHPRLGQQLAWIQLSEAYPSLQLSGEVAAGLLSRHFDSPAMWAVIPLQDLLAIDESLRHPDPAAERINDPSVMPHYWRYRMHLGLQELAAADGLNGRIRRMLGESGRVGSSDA